MTSQSVSPALADTQEHSLHAGQGSPSIGLVTGCATDLSVQVGQGLYVVLKLHNFVVSQ